MEISVFKNILDKTLFNKELFRKTFLTILTPLIVFTINRALIGYFPELKIIASLLWLINFAAVLFVVYASLNATHYFAIISKPRRRKTAIANISIKEFGRLLLIAGSYLLGLFLIMLILYLFKFITYIPFLGQFLLIALMPLIFAGIFVLAFYIITTTGTFLAAFIGNKDNKNLFKNIQNSLVVFRTNAVKIGYNLLLSSVIVLIPLLALFLLIGTTTILIISFLFKSIIYWYFANFISYLSMAIFNTIVFSVPLTFLINAYAGISYTIYQEFK